MSEDGTEGRYAASIGETITQPLLVLDSELNVQEANPAFLEQFQVARDATVGHRVYDLGNGQWNIPELRRLLEEVLPQNRKVQNYRVEHDFETIGSRVMLLNANRMQRRGEPDLILSTQLSFYPDGAECIVEFPL